MTVNLELRLRAKLAWWFRPLLWSLSMHVRFANWVCGRADVCKVSIQ